MWKKVVLGAIAALALAAGTFAAAAEPATKPPEYNGKPLDFWLKALRSEDQNLQNQAVYVVSTAGPAAKAAVPDLVALLKKLKPGDDTRGLRYTIAGALGNIGPDARPALPAITAMLDDKFPAQQVASAVLAIGGGTEEQERAAVRILLLASQKCRVSVLLGDTAYLEKNAAKLIPHFATLLKDNQGDVRRLAAMGLGMLGAKAKSTAGALLDSLKDSEPIVVAQAAQSLVRVDETHLKTATAALLPLLRSEPGRSQAASALLAIGPRVAPLVIPELGDKDGNVRAVAQEILAALGEPVAGLLIETLGSEQPQLRAGAAHLLGIIYRGSRKPVPAIAKALKDPDAVVRCKAAVALVAIDPATAIPAIPVLLEALRHAPVEDALEATTALGNMGPRAEAAGPALREIMRHLNERIPMVRCPKVSLIPRLYAAAFTLEAVDHAGAKPAIEVLITMLDDRAYPHRAEAAMVLSRFGADARDAVPSLKEALKGDERLLCMAAQSLVKIAPEEAKPAVSAVIELLKKQMVGRHPSYQVLQTLAALGPLARDAVPLLESMLEGKKADRYYPIAEALVKVDPSKTPKVIERLMTALLDEDEDCYGPLDTLCRIAPDAPAEVTRAFLDVLKNPKMARQQKVEIMNALSEVGTEGKAVVVPILTELSKDKDKAVATRAARQLEQFKAELAQQP
jgi:HEAT repeat protein